jgi:hypothetical protein
VNTCSSAVLARVRWRALAEPHYAAVSTSDKAL